MIPWETADLGNRPKIGGRLMHHQNVSLQNAPSKRTLLTSLKRSKAGPPQLKRSKKYVLMVHFAVIRFDGASGACQEKGKCPEVVRGGCKTSFGPREQRSPRRVFCTTQTLFCTGATPACTSAKGFFACCVQKDLLHPLLTTFPVSPKLAN